MNKKVYGLIGIAALAAVGGTFAYYNAAQTFTNPFDTTNFSTSTTEKFNPDDGDGWKPGKEVDKEVIAQNTGDGLVWVRVKFDEVWTRTEGETETSFGMWDSSQAGFLPTDAITAARNGTDHQPDHDPIKEDENKNPVGGKIDGYTDQDKGSVVYKKLLNLAEDVPQSPAEQWYYKDGYYYYAKALEKGDKTLPLLESVTLCGDTDMGYFSNIDVWKVVEKDATAPDYTTDPNGWEPGTPSNAEGKDVYHYKAHQLDTENQGYANAGYTLNITVEFVQADEKSAQAFPAAGWTDSEGVFHDAKWSWIPPVGATSSSTGGNEEVPDGGEGGSNQTTA